MLAPLFLVLTDKEYDGRWIAEIIHFPGAIAYGRTKEEAILNVFMIAHKQVKYGRTRLWW